MPLAAGSFLGRYEVLSPLGAGGMGEVYRARDSCLNRVVAVNGAEKNRPRRGYIGSIDGSAPRPVTPESHTFVLPLHNGSAVLTTRDGADLRVYPLHGGEPRLLPWKRDPAEQLIQTTADDRWVYSRRREGIEVSIFRIELNSGRRELWKVIKPSNAVGVRDLGILLLTPDGTSYALGVARDSGDLYLAEGLR